MVLKISIALAILWGQLAAGVVPPPVEGLYGPEFTFTYNGDVTAEKSKEYIAQIRSHLEAGQPPPARFHVSNISSYPQFVSPNGWWFKVTSNPGVVEIPMSPLTVREFRQYKDDIQSAIFVNAAIVGLYPWDYLGGGHLNFDIRIFGGRVMLARNFLADFWSHNELSMGALNYDTNNAVPFALYQNASIQAVVHVLDRAAAGEWPDTELGVRQFLNEVRIAQEQHADVVGHGSRAKYHDLNLNHPGRIELRAVRPQISMDVWVNQIELIESRINNHLRFIEKPLPLRFRVPSIDHPEFESNEGHKYIPPVDPQKALLSFHQYVGEAGLDWQNHRNYLWPPWIKDGEIEKFEASAEFKSREQVFRRKRLRLSCEESLKR